MKFELRVNKKVLGVFETLLLAKIEAAEYCNNSNQVLITRLAAQLPNPAASEVWYFDYEKEDWIADYPKWWGL